MSISTSPHLTSNTVTKVAEQAALPLTELEAHQLTSAFEETLQVVDRLNQLDVSSTTPTSQVTGLENIMREDEAQPKYSFTQAEALANATTTHRGFFVVERLIDRDALTTTDQPQPANT